MRLLAQRRAQAARRWTTARSLQAILLVLAIATGTEIVESHLAAQDSDVLAQLSTDPVAPTAVASSTASGPLVALAPTELPATGRLARTIRARRVEHRSASSLATEAVLLMLIAAQVQLARATRRLLSLPLLLATGLAVYTTGLVGFLTENEMAVACMELCILALAVLGLWRHWREVS